jgi:hypothetical protein
MRLAVEKCPDLSLNLVSDTMKYLLSFNLGAFTGRWIIKAPVQQHA